MAHGAGREGEGPERRQLKIQENSVPFVLFCGCSSIFSIAK
jgi:hypothetical protein